MLLLSVSINVFCDHSVTIINGSFTDIQKHPTRKFRGEFVSGEFSESFRISDDGAFSFSKKNDEVGEIYVYSVPVIGSERSNFSQYLYMKRPVVDNKLITLPDEKVSYPFSSDVVKYQLLIKMPREPRRFERLVISFMDSDDVVFVIDNAFFFEKLKSFITSGEIPKGMYRINIKGKDFSVTKEVSLSNTNKNGFSIVELVLKEEEIKPDSDLSSVDKQEQSKENSKKGVTVQ